MNIGFPFMVMFLKIDEMHLEKVIDSVAIKIICSVMLKLLLVHSDLIKAKIGKKLFSILRNGGFVNLLDAKLVF
jgi:hypothetical protein